MAETITIEQKNQEEYKISDTKGFEQTVKYRDLAGALLILVGKHDEVEIKGTGGKITPANNAYELKDSTGSVRDSSPSAKMLLKSRGNLDILTKRKTHPSLKELLMRLAKEKPELREDMMPLLRMARRM